VRTCGTPATVETIGCCAAVVYGSYRHHIVVGHVANCVHGTAPCSGVLRRSVRTKACAVARAGIRIGSTVGCSETHVRRSRTRIRLHCAVRSGLRVELPPERRRRRKRRKLRQRRQRRRSLLPRRRRQQVRPEPLSGTPEGTPGVPDESMWN
jgi:hypothetical protein